MQIYCPIRKEWVARTPEELVRQQTLNHMTCNLGFPPELILVEKSLHQLPHLKVHEMQNVPQRRMDIVAFFKVAKNASELLPLLLVECKAVSITGKSFQQAMGYNYTLKAPFITLVNQNTWKTGWRDHKTNAYSFIDFLPTYDDLKKFLGL